MNRNSFTLLSTTLIFFSTFFLGNDTTNSSMAESAFNRDNTNLLKGESKQESKKTLPQYFSNY